MIRRYAVLDADGVKVNTITADEALIATAWYPGYGAFLVDEGEHLPDPPKPPVPTRPETFAVLPFTPVDPMQNGDRMDTKTGEVIKKPVVADDVIEITITEGGGGGGTLGR